VLIGTRDLGAVHRVGSECIKTRFWVLVVPIVPRQSFYVLNARLPSMDGFRIPLQRSSVVVAYLRALAGVALVGSGGALLWTNDPRWWFALIAAATVLVLAFAALGRLSPDERHRRHLLRQANGIGTPPELMRHTMREHALERALRRWQQRFPGQPWSQRAEAAKLEEEELVLLHALAELSHQPLLARELRDRRAARPLGTMRHGL